ncbi:hypothetical protein [Shewanella algidipiscicola]|uniref:Uncharacterized protein n=1 Tax=Shewanella algidipiscicola TaxID=614070 RepID=A0ABQ4NTL9_9GAMM|nr:hypothetical protein [Shewanella algidipiscicola]GIU03078.1 hypothetical protein TUM4630_36170 [Shewanella algidipiscicola]
MNIDSDESKQIIEDICYLENLIDTEKTQFRQAVATKLANAESIDDKAEVIVDEVALVLATMSARISVIEKVLTSDEKISPNTVLSQKKTSSKVEVNNTALLDEVKLSIVDIGKRNDLWHLTHTPDNKPYYALAPNSKVNFVLPINRKIKQTLAVDIIQAKPHGLLNGVQFHIDGHKLKHKVKTVDGITRLICYLPKSKTGNTTYVTVILPDSNGDEYKFMMSDVNCVPKLSLSSFAQKLVN